MKRTITTALALTLLCGTSAFAQGGQPWARGAGGSFQGGQSQEAAAALQQERRNPPAQAQAAPARPQQAEPQQERPRSQEQARPQDREQPQRPQGERPQGQQQQGQRPQGQQPQGQQPQGQRPQGQAPQGQRPQGDRPQGPQGQQQPQRPAQQGPVRPGASAADRATAEVIARAAGNIRELDRDRPGPGRGPDRDGRPGYNDGRGPGGPGGYDRPGGPQTRPPVIRPEDRRDRDRNRPRYDQRTFPRYITPQRQYQWRGSPWRPPVGFYSYRWQYGQILPWTWYTPNYYLDYRYYGLRMPPIGCEWVRAGDDAILVDVFTGRVYQVVYNLFW